MAAGRAGWRGRAPGAGCAPSCGSPRAAIGDASPRAAGGGEGSRPTDAAAATAPRKGRRPRPALARPRGAGRRDPGRAAPPGAGPSAAAPHALGPLPVWPPQRAAALAPPARGPRGVRASARLHRGGGTPSRPRSRGQGRVAHGDEYPGPPPHSRLGAQHEPSAVTRGGQSCFPTLCSYAPVKDSRRSRPGTRKRNYIEKLEALRAKTCFPNVEGF